jgi:hypothetical protein
MAFKVFLSYRNGPEEQLVVWRLQTLAAAYGINVFVPVRNGLQRASVQGRLMPPQDVRRKIEQADCVLAIMTGTPGPAVRAELSYASTKGITVIPILAKGVSPPAFLAGSPVFYFSPSDPGAVETQVVEYLKRQQFSKQKQQAVGALVAIGVGMFLLAALSER